MTQTTSPPYFGLCNSAIYDLIRSRRKSSGNSGPGSALFRIMTSKIPGVGKKRYNRARSRLRRTRIPTGIFRGAINSPLTINTGRVPGEIPDTWIFVKVGRQESTAEKNSGIRTIELVTVTIPTPCQILSPFRRLVLEKSPILSFRNGNVSTYQCSVPMHDNIPQPPHTRKREASHPKLFIFIMCII